MGNSPLMPRPIHSPCLCYEKKKLVIHLMTMTLIWGEVLRSEEACISCQHIIYRPIIHSILQVCFPFKIGVVAISLFGRIWLFLLLLFFVVAISLTRSQASHKLDKWMLYIYWQYLIIYCNILKLLVCLPNSIKRSLRPAFYHWVFYYILLLQILGSLRFRKKRSVQFFPLAFSWMG